MRKNLVKLAAAAAVVLSTSACYHATVDTGRPSNGVTVSKNWAHSFIEGLVPPSTLETAQQCPNGVAKVETQISFLNGLARLLTFGIYTPMEITVQCAGPTAMTGDAQTIQVARMDLGNGLGQAAALSAESGEAVFVQIAE
ncbi:MAG TPA: Bor family protein [Longimicrobium sp.]|nr:Bor family protein [Longimicrobium sp.]